MNHKILQQPPQQHARALTPAPFICNGSSTPMGVPQSSPAYTHARTHANPHSSENLRRASSAANSTESAASGVSYVFLGVQMWDESFIRMRVCSHAKCDTLSLSLSFSRERTLCHEEMLCACAYENVCLCVYVHLCMYPSTYLCINLSGYLCI